MENNVRRCTLFAVVWLIVGLAICLIGIINGNNKLTAAASEDLTTQAVTEENVNSVARYRPTKDDAKLPDEGRPEHANAVEPPTLMLAIDGVPIGLHDLSPALRYGGKLMGIYSVHGVRIFRHDIDAARQVVKHLLHLVLHS